MKTIKIWMISLLMMVGLTNIVNASVPVSFLSVTEVTPLDVAFGQSAILKLTLKDITSSNLSDVPHAPNEMVRFESTDGTPVALNTTLVRHTAGSNRYLYNITSADGNRDQNVKVSVGGTYQGQAWEFPTIETVLFRRDPPDPDTYPIDPSKSTIIAADEQVIADGVDSTTVTVALRDTQNNPMRKATIVPSQSYNGSATESIIGNVVDHNDGTYTFNVRSNTVEQVIYSVVATSTYHGNQTTTETIAQEDDEATVSFVPSETFTTGSPYAKNSSKTHTLGIPGSSSLNVKIVGETEDQVDTIIIKDKQGHKTKYSGILAEEFTVEGDMIDVSFMSDGSIEKSGVTVTVSASNVGKTRFETEHPYQNNTHSEETLSISGANRLKVTIDGEVENKYDFITIVDASGQETRLTGVLSKELTVNGDHIKVKFDSDYSVVKNGATVQIEALN